MSYTVTQIVINIRKKVSIIKKTKKEIDDVRALLNQMVDCKDIELTDKNVVDLSKELDELINEYMRTEKIKKPTS